MTKQTGQATLEEKATEVALEKKQARIPISRDEAIAVIDKHIKATKLSRTDEAYIELALRDNPDLWRVVGDMALQSQSRLIEAMTSQPTAQVAIRHGIAKMRASLGEEDAPLIERLLIDQVILCWLNLNWVQRSHAGIMANSVTLTAGAYWEKRLSMAQARYLKAIETLAKVRRLSKAMPLQVNIGGQQINVAGVQKKQA